jgi:hypothetical protein
VQRGEKQLSRPVKSWRRRRPSTQQPRSWFAAKVAIGEQNYRALAALFGVNTPDLPPLEHENVHYAYAAEMEIAALRQRIAELESHAFTVEPFRSFVTDADLAALHRFAECCDDPESGGHDLEKEQVRRLEEIGALRRHGRVHWITDFGDVLISITAGIKWEAE